jgi:hypothetical protein
VGVEAPKVVNSRGVELPEEMKTPEVELPGETKTLEVELATVLVDGMKPPGDEQMDALDWKQPRCANFFSEALRYVRKRSDSRVEGS